MEKKSESGEASDDLHQQKASSSNTPNPENHQVDQQNSPGEASLGHSAPEFNSDESLSYIRTSPAQRRRAVQILFACLLCVGIGQSLILSVFPPLARELGFSELQTGAVFSISAICWVFLGAF